jgi:predicted RNase H-like nuclease
VAEVFPHPALVRWSGRARIFKYKRGRVEQRREEFAALQHYLRGALDRDGLFAEVRLAPMVEDLLRTPWSKAVEDQTDALVAGLVAWQMVRSAGRETEVLGDRETGFLVVPKARGDQG